MKPTRDLLILAAIYLVGINVYYALWFLGSEGAALQWGEPGLDFGAHWLSAMIAALANVSLIVFLINSSDKKKERELMPRIAPLIMLISLLTFAVIFSMALAIQAFTAGASSILSFFTSMAFVSISFFHFELAGLMMMLHLPIIRNGGVISFFLLSEHITYES